MRPTCSILLFFALVCPAQQQKLERNGNLWVYSNQGSGCASATRVRVVAAGRLTVISADQKDVSFKWSRQIRASGRQAAQQSSFPAQVTAVQKGDWCIVTVSDPMPAGSAGELAVTIPRRITDHKLETRFGAINVRGISGEIFASTEAGNLDLDDLGGNVIARTGGGAITCGRIQGSLRCLSGGGNIRVGQVLREAVLESAGGEIFVDDAGGMLRLSTSGNIHVARADQAVIAHTTGGLIDIGRAGGMVTAESAGGGIQVGSARGVRCESANGTIRLKNVSGSVRASVGTGHLFVYLVAGQQMENSFLATGRGDITVFLPSNLAVTVKALNETAGWMGRVISDFSEVQVQPSEAGSGRPVVAQGALNGGGPVLMLSTSGGAIYLKRLR